MIAKSPELGTPGPAPLSEESPEASPPVSAVELPAPPHPLRVLVVDDSSMLRRVLQRGVERGGHDCVAAGDGIEALEVFDTYKPDVIISDWEMPRMDGPELCRRVRERASDAYPYFIFLTALNQREHILAAMAAGADDYLEKPLDPHALDAALVAASRVTDLHARLRDQRDDLRRLNDRLYGDARRDPLTGLGNRLRLREDLAALSQSQDTGRAGEEPDELGAKRTASGDCVALCDIDFFKRYNDNEGHLAGDEVLVSVAETIRDTVRGGDTVYRYGGEEFLLLLPGATLAEGGAAVERVRAALERRAIAHANSEAAPVVTISCGVANTPRSGGEPIKDWLQRADEALYAAKAAGRNRVECSARPAVIAEA